MSEDTGTTEVQTEEQIQSPAPPTIEDQAREMGWKPKEEYEGDPGKWVDASIFVARAPLFEKIDSLSRELKSRNKDIEALKTHYNKVAETEYNRALQTLRAERREKLEEGDLAGAEEVSERIDELKSTKQATQVAQQATDQVQPPQEFVDWVAENKWYANDQELRDSADAIGHKYVKRGLPPAEVLKRVSEDVKKLHPEKFRNPNKERASAVETKTSTSKPAVNAVEAFEKTMSQDEIRVMNRLVNSGVMTKEKYIEDLKKVRG